MLAIQIDHTIQAPATVVWLYLSDPEQVCGEVHPIICKVLDTYGGRLTGSMKIRRWDPFHSWFQLFRAGDP